MTDYLAENGVTVVAAAHLGGGFIRALEAEGIRYAECEGAVEAVAKEMAARFGT